MNVPADGAGMPSIRDASAAAAAAAVEGASSSGVCRCVPSRAIPQMVGGRPGPCAARTPAQRPLRDAMSITKRYFTSLRSIRS
jgi:hypothetical protein